MVSLPLTATGGRRGTFNLYAGQKGFFTDEELRLLDELATDISFALKISKQEAERQQAEEALRESEAKFRQLTENIREVLWMTDPAKGTMLYISPTYEAIWGRTCVSLCASPRDWLNAIMPEDRTRVEAALPQQEVGNYTEEYRIKRPDGTVRWIRDKAFPVRDQAGRVIRVVGIAEDITARKGLEQQFFRAQRLEAIGTLASGVAHDLNNIFAPVLLAAGLLRGRMAAEADRRSLTLIEQSAQRGANIINQLLTFSRGNLGQRVLLNPKHLIKEMVEFMQEMFPRNIEITREQAEEPWHVLADATQLHQVLLNLCVNAQDAMPEGGRLRLGSA